MWNASSSAVKTGAGRISSSNSLQSLPKRAESPAASSTSSSTSSSSSSASEIMLKSSESNKKSSKVESSTVSASTTHYICTKNSNNGGGGGSSETRQLLTTTTANNGNPGGVMQQHYYDETKSSMNGRKYNHHHQQQTFFFFPLLGSILLVLLLATLVLQFSLWFPFVLPHPIGIAALHTYEPAWYHYDAVHTKFDNTVWTYGTDYGLTILMFYLAARCWNNMGGERNATSSSSSSFRLRLYSSSLLLCYGLSTLAGGLAHQYFTSLESLNTRQFQWLWTMCVGNVAFASGYMGLIGREVQAIFGVKTKTNDTMAVEVLPLGPWWFWPAYGTYMAGAVAMGYMSFKRPACDIFIAGITQFPTTFYCLCALGLRKWPRTRRVTAVPGASEGPAGASSFSSTSTMEKTSPIGHVRLPYRIMYYVGFIGNAPLLPMYPLLVQYSGMSLAGINTLLHSWLMVMWGMQGISLLHLLNAIELHRPKVSKD